MKQIFATVLMLSCASASASDDGFFWFLKNRLIRKAHRVTHKLEIKNYDLKTDRHDACAVDQLETFIGDFHALNRSQKDDTRKHFEAVNTLEVLASRYTGSLNGESYYLRWEDCRMVCTGARHISCHQECRNHYKRIGENTTLAGVNPRTKTSFDSAAASLSIQTEFLYDNVLRKIWFTRNPNIFDSIRAYNDAAFTRELASGGIRWDGSATSNDPICGSIHLGEILAQ